MIKSNIVPLLGHDRIEVALVVRCVVNGVLSEHLGKCTSFPHKSASTCKPTPMRTLSTPMTGFVASAVFTPIESIALMWIGVCHTREQCIFPCCPELGKDFIWSTQSDHIEGI